jgi:hypothetical protein
VNNKTYKDTLKLLIGDEIIDIGSNITLTDGNKFIEVYVSEFAKCRNSSDYRIRFNRIDEIGEFDDTDL